MELASNACFGNDFEAAMAWGRRCADEAEAAGDAACAMGGRAVAAFVRTLLGDTAAARVETLAAAAACDALSDAELQQRPEVLFFLCGAEMYLEHLDPLVAHARRGIEAAREGGRGAAWRRCSCTSASGCCSWGTWRRAGRCSSTPRRAPGWRAARSTRRGCC